ncbi:diguanylate cyclase domain-containing protein [Simiduia litorea]|uniref:diguanylate cyclase domain-containing protein n=1 Tax=Simiduia litorea TaxID=1435348 RepID=UPI0036F1BEBD
MLDKLKAQLRSKMFFDLIASIFLYLLCLIWFAQVDALEQLIEFTHRYEEFELDELLSSTIVLTFLFAIFAYRRWRDVRKLSLYCEELSMIDPITLLPNRRVIDRLLREIRDGRDSQNSFPLSLILVDINGLENIQSRLGNAVAEQATLELFYRYSLLLETDQLISYRNANQCLLFCPKFDQASAEALCEKICQVELDTRKTTLNLLSFKAVSITLKAREEIDGVFDRLEDLLCLRQFNGS